MKFGGDNQEIRRPSFFIAHPISTKRFNAMISFKHYEEKERWFTCGHISLNIKIVPSDYMQCCKCKREKKEKIVRM
jgi:hypothetical protein